MRTLQDWLRWQEGLHPSEIELGLERVASVWQKLDDGRRPAAVISIAGTNGKGSCAAMLDAIYQAAGYRTGLYTSPHLWRYNERVRVNAVQASDAQLCDAFAAIDAARGQTSLTYFEFGTLAALTLFQQAELDVWILEVGLGGRLDAVNIIDADVALISSIGVDHTEWLGPTREQIGFEKAGIMRAQGKAVCGDTDPPQTLLDKAQDENVELYIQDRDFGVRREEVGWTFWRSGATRAALPDPALRGARQWHNAASVVMSCDLLNDKLPIDQAALRQGLLAAQLPGRFEVQAGTVTWIYDVAHNPQAIEVMRDNLNRLDCRGRRWALVGMLADKDVEAVGALLKEAFDAWAVAGLSVGRGLDAASLGRRLASAGVAAPMAFYDSVAQARDALQQEVRSGDCVLVFGSFYTVAQARLPVSEAGV